VVVGVVPGDVGAVVGLGVGEVDASGSGSLVQAPSRTRPATAIATRFMRASVPAHSTVPMQILTFEYMFG
jgi:hypothetical protein